jgi:hypothetical protein
MHFAAVMAVLVKPPGSFAELWCADFPRKWRKTCLDCSRQSEWLVSIDSPFCRSRIADPAAVLRY